FGNVLQTSGDAVYFARHIGLRSGVPKEVPALTVNRLCGSGLQAILLGAQEIQLGQAEFVLAGGGENMSMAPHMIRGARWGLPLGEQKLEDYLWVALVDSYNGLGMANTAENLGRKYGIGREGHQRRRGGGRRRVRGGRAEGRTEADRAHRLRWRLRRGPGHHGHRPRAIEPPSPEARRPHGRGHGPGRDQRGVRDAVPGGGEGSRPRPREDERERGRDRTRSSARGI